MRKGRCIILIGSLFPLCIHGQILNTPYNLPRSGDRLMKCQIATIPPSKSGIQTNLEFCRILSIKRQIMIKNMKFKVVILLLASNIVRYTINRNSGDSLFCMGFENHDLYKLSTARIIVCLSNVSRTNYQ